MWNGLVFNNFKASMGGRVRLFLSSDYPLPPNTRHFLQMYALVLVHRSCGKLTSE
jgi:long-subunit acyl-CoA synthetase (AMP-forming)